MPQIWLNGVCKYYPREKKRFPAVKDIELTIEQGEFVFITGSSGAGKSTLLQLIAGDIQPSLGTVFLDQRDVTHLSRRRRERCRMQFGRVPQLPQLMRKHTIAENLKMAAMLGADRRAESVQGRMEKALHMVGLSGVEGRYPVELSIGECRRVELARAIINSPPILVLDELTASLDEDTIWDMFHLLGELNRLGTTVIMATHAKKFVNLMRRRVITLVDGMVFGDVKKGRYGDIV